MVLLSRLIAMFLHIFLLMVGVVLNEASAQQCGPPNLVSATPQYNATASTDPLVMNCAGATLPAMFKWEFNGNIVPSAVEFLYVVQSVMEGEVYRCGYDNINCPGGTIWSTGSITVITQPNISVSTGPVSVMQGDTVTVHCNVTSGYPAPSITWYNGSGDSLGHVSPLTVTTGSNDTLTCIATNTAGYTVGSIAITVTSLFESSTIASMSPSTAVISSSIATSSSSLITNIHTGSFSNTTVVSSATSTLVYSSSCYVSYTTTTATQPSDDKTILIGQLIMIALLLHHSPLVAIPVAVIICLIAGVSTAIITGIIVYCIMKRRRIKTMEVTQEGPIYDIPMVNTEERPGPIDTYFNAAYGQIST
ncbi:PREDICTED: uncharacterized protein LOC109585145 isoform X1 [Amphimedon queenslandica]|uniref:Ig-like domain-containing protein n=1 Tax=Amphimedon queenslandica TaxID=400682 RepID=A0AAN0JIP3_AMPQE|nr:PREDICTED: uncharacterized protein LOC109585145 isoform X1 [Amphimedon queenslandica]|eukprot:XP_019856671.1 PREDICTED: uncharacterized protein LOC109585145 isoform X1 [Amphimedon queenslandica]